MIYGIGNDIVQLSRIERLYTRYGDALAQRLLTKQEQQEYAFSKQKTRFLAKHFAAKEAFAKAVGTGLRGVVSFRHITVAHNEQGKPFFVCAPCLNEYLATRQIDVVHLSLSDEQDYVLAFAIAECLPQT